MDKQWLQSDLFKNGVATVILAFVLLTARYLSAKYIRRAEKSWTSQQRLRWIGYVRNIFFAILLLGLIYIWGEAIHGLAVSVFAIAFALVFAVKELFMNMNGALVRFRGGAYDIGDRIEIKNIRGDVIDMSLLTTTVLEVGRGAAAHQYTGKRIVFPNNLLLTDPVVNESFLENYYMNNIRFPLHIGDDWKAAKEILLRIAQEECAPYIEQARYRFRKIEKNKSLELPSVEPKISIQIPDPDTIHLHLRIPSPGHLKGRLEQVVVTRFLDEFRAKGN
ncbi:MAG: mechanosensitive ion channel family protein [Simkaniaceae bacterium]